MYIDWIPKFWGLGFEVNAGLRVVGKEEESGVSDGYITSAQHKDPQTRTPKSYKQTFEYCLKAQLNKPFYHHEKMNPCSGNCSCGASCSCSNCSSHKK
ncbi:hypothetical protein PTTG_12745 [Puccinia triticina 1-1 BBBD Race 1]|uniref:Uncharacterized protein n=1 Tax=Puccinia triticina (isolate 1-1 / race 1 (BBBD)) TaxID=630390 RepID=A0A180GUD6_PUCT1|nr:hypothetical protein PTTG_12745 [Puccinia triticina 1-1 BBBD Race 1]